MIYDVRTYTLYPRKTKEYVGHFETMAMPAVERLGFRLVGYFTSSIGTLNQVVHIWAYEDLAEFDKLRTLRDGDAEWHKFLEATVGLIHAQEDKVMLPVNFSPLQ